jgi:hypothetical protein
VSAEEAPERPEKSDSLPRAGRGARKECLPYKRSMWVDTMSPPTMEAMTSLDVELAVASAAKGHIILAWARRSDMPNEWKFFSAEISTPSSISECEVYIRGSVASMQERFPLVGWDFCNVDCRRRESCPFDEEPSDEPVLLEQLFEVSGFWRVEDDRHINMKELATVRNVLERLQVSNCTIDVVMDNTSALGMLRKMDSAKYEYNRELARLQEVLARKGIRIRGLSYVNTAFNTADGLSRLQRQ